MDIQSTAEPQTPKPQNLRLLKSDDIPLARIELQRAGRINGGETVVQISEKYFALRDEREREQLTQAERRQQERQQMLMNRMRNSARAAGIDPTGLSDEEIVVRFKEIELLREQREAEKQRENRAKQQRIRSERLFREAQCPPRHTANMDLPDDSPKQWRETLETLSGQLKYAKGFLVALLGERGVGKSQLCVNLIHRACATGLSARYAKTVGVHRSLRDTYGSAHGKPAMTEADVIRQWTTPKLLVLDEFHEKSKSEAENAFITQIIDLRYDNRLMTVLVANQSPKDFAECAGHSIASRITESGTAIACKWPSFRKPGKWKASDDCPLRPEVKAVGEFVEDE